MNKAIVMGRLCADPDIRSTQSGKSVATLRIAVNRQLGKNAPEGAVKADFFNCVAWEKKAEFARNYLRKGVKVVIEGRLRNREYTDKDGQKRVVTEIIVEDVEFAESKAAAQQPQQAAAGLDEQVPF